MTVPDITIFRTAGADAGDELRVTAATHRRKLVPGLLFSIWDDNTRTWNLKRLTPAEIDTLADVLDTYRKGQPS